MSTISKKIKHPVRSALLVAILGLTVNSPVNATSFSFSGSSGNLAASVDLSISGGILTAVLTNTSNVDANAPGDVLTGFFFNVSGSPTLTPVSALLTSGSTVVYDPNGQPLAGNVGGEWDYNANVPSSGPGNGTQGISSSGLGIFGAATFNGPNLAGPSASVDGVQYGILPAGWSSVGDNGGLTGSGGLTLNSVTFLLSGIANDAIFSDVYFQYGTALTEPSFPGSSSTSGGGPSSSTSGGGPSSSTSGGGNIPEPSSLALLGLGMLTSVFSMRRRGFQA